MTAPALRPLRPVDLPAIASWLPEGPLWQRYGYTPSRIEAALNAALEAGDLLIAADIGGDQATGFCWCLPAGMFGTQPYLKILAVDPAHTGHGLGSAMLRQLVARLTDDRQTAIYLLVSDFNTPAQRFYVRHGFRQIGRIPEPFLPDVDELLYVRRLMPVL